MSGILAARALLLLAALVALRRARSPRGTAFAGLAGAAALLGPGPEAVPQPSILGVALLAAGAGVAAGVALRGAGLEPALLVASALVAGLSLLGAEGSRANAEAGWRRGLAWAAAVAVPPLAGGGLLVAGASLSPVYRLLGPAGGLLVALAAWIAPFLLERRRVFRELSEEAGLGILPAEDLLVLGSPWRRAREPRLGRADERREYVRSALLLAVARQQQRRRTGEAIRLRQLEVLAFRTRVRRAVEARAARYAPVPDELAV